MKATDFEYEAVARPEAAGLAQLGFYLVFDGFNPAIVDAVLRVTRLPGYSGEQ